jgi:hypothetical protein
VRPPTTSGVRYLVTGQAADNDVIAAECSARGAVVIDATRPHEAVVDDIVSAVT